MGPALAAALVAALCAGGLEDVRAEVSGRAEARSETLAPEGLGAQTRPTLDVRPRAALVAEGPRLQLWAAYSPWLRVPDVRETYRLELGHEVGVALQGRSAERWQLGATLRALRGRVDPLNDLWREFTPNSTTPLPTLRRLEFEAAEARVGFGVALDRRTTLRADASALVSAGTDADARAVFPLSRVAHAYASLVRSASRNDDVTVAGTVLASRTDGAGDVGVIGLDLAWRHRLSATLESLLGAGATADRFELPGDGRAPHQSVAPSALLGLEHTSPRGHAEALTLRAITAIDRYGGRSYRAAELRGTARHRFARRFTLDAAATALRSIPQDDVLFGGLDLTAGWDVREGFALEAGVRGRWQQDRLSGRPSFLEAVAFLGIRFVAATQPPRFPAGPGLDRPAL